MEVVAEAVLSVSLELLFEKLSSSDVLKFAGQEHIQKELNIWERKLLEISEVLNDAEEKQIAKQSVKVWLSDLRDLAYDMEDVLDEFSYEALRGRLETESSTSSKVRKFIPTCCGPVQAIRNVKMGSKIKDLNMRLDDIYARKAGLGLDKAAAITHSTWERPLTTSSLVHEPWVFGRDADKQNIMDMLLKDGEPNQTDIVSVVSIVAMGGTGKTTLARLVYDDDKIINHFNLKAWACVSDPFDAVRVSNTILNDFTSGSSADSRELNHIQEKLRQELKGKKFLLVLDDVWTDNYCDWDYLRSPFWSGAHGSKILITTRNKNVAMMIGGDKNLYELRHLSDDDCWSVFQKHAFEHKNVDVHQNLVSIGREIVKKCGGLPLAARALGGLLRHENREDRWNIVLNSPTLDLPGDCKFNILPALKLSYNVLPSPLKRCFGYCAIFPKDYEFDKEELIGLWMAEGFVQQSESNRQKIQMEDLGDDYFQELLSRSFFQPSTSNTYTFVMHDIVSDLAKFVATKICFSLEENLERNQQLVISEKFRHSSFTCGDYDVFKKFEIFHGMEAHLRTFVALPKDARLDLGRLSNKVLEVLIPKLKCLRVLSLSHYEIHEIPDSIGDLKHLRYLNLLETKVKLLPESIGKLYMLQTLILSMCSNLTRLPLSIRNLNSLQYLDVTYTPLEKMPPQMSKLKSLQRLSTFIVGKGNASNMKELMSMSHLKGRLHISKLENVIDVPYARAASGFTKQKLENLTMSWSGSGNVGNQLELLDSLQPHLGLNELQIEGYGGPKFPHWLEDVQFSKVVEIKLVDCQNCKFLPRLGQLPMLKHLEIKGMDEVKTVGKEFHGESTPFPKLESLTFRNMPQWEDWESLSSSLSESYPHLLKLCIKDCPKLVKELPTYLPSLVRLDIRTCPQLESPLARFPSLSRAYINTSSEGVVRSGVDFYSLKKLEIYNIRGLTQLQGGFVQLLSGLQLLRIHDCDELRWLWVEENGFDGIQQLQTSSSPKEQQGLFSKLQSLEIERCRNLEKLPNGLHMLTCLKELRLCGCSKLSSFPDSGFPPMLTRLTIWGWGGLTHLPDWIMVARDGSDRLVCILEYLSIGECPSLVCFPEGQLPPTLQTLIIDKCEKLESLPEGMMMQPPYDSSSSSDDGLQVLEIRYCSSLRFFPAGKFPSTLKELSIGVCSQLESISEKMFYTNNNSLEVLNIEVYSSLRIIPDCLYNLKGLRIYICENLERLPHQMQNLQELAIGNCDKLEELPHHMQNLRELRVNYCQKLEGLPHQMQNLRELHINYYHKLEGLPHQIQNLRQLSINNCEKLEWLPHQMQNLGRLNICNCKNVELESYQMVGLTPLISLNFNNCERMRIPLSEWGLAMLPSLKELIIGGIFPEITSFPNGPSLLPTTLTSLTIHDFQNLKSLASLSLQTLTSLEVLNIWHCPKLESFCPKEGLPDTLSQLHIGGCPLLTKRCSKQKGQDWAHISHIPFVRIDDRNRGL